MDYKAINTLDSMIGYKNDTYIEFGKFSARFDDVANFIPSRITGFSFILFTKNKTKPTAQERFKLWLQDAKKHPSPNSGYLEAATSYQLGIRLGGYNSYHGKKSFRAYMGEPDVPLRQAYKRNDSTYVHCFMGLYNFYRGCRSCNFHPMGLITSPLQTFQHSKMPATSLRFKRKCECFRISTESERSWPQLHRKNFGLSSSGGRTV